VTLFWPGQGFGAGNPRRIKVTGGGRAIMTQSVEQTVYIPTLCNVEFLSPVSACTVRCVASSPAPPNPLITSVSIVYNVK
jgi:hypothetical protein